VLKLFHRYKHTIDAKSTNLIAWLVVEPKDTEGTKKRACKKPGRKEDFLYDLVMGMVHWRMMTYEWS
jgi:hypothetical protein